MLIITVALCVAFLVRTFVHVVSVDKFPWEARDQNDFVLHILCAGSAYLIGQDFDMSLAQIAMTAFLADTIVALREGLVVLTDMCKIKVLSASTRRRV